MVETEYGNQHFTYDYSILFNYWAELSVKLSATASDLKYMLSRFNYVNIMAADALAPYVARTSAAMILTT